MQVEIQFFILLLCLWPSSKKGTSLLQAANKFRTSFSFTSSSLHSELSSCLSLTSVSFSSTCSVTIPVTVANFSLAFSKYLSLVSSSVKSSSTSRILVDLYSCDNLGFLATGDSVDWLAELPNAFDRDFFFLY